MEHLVLLAVIQEDQVVAAEHLLQEGLLALAGQLHNLAAPVAV
jgi:hypothetical protein